MLRLGSLHVGLDPGTAKTLLYVQGRGIVLNEPSMLIVRASSGEVEFVGEEAELGWGRLPRKFDLEWPVRRGRIANSTLFEAMLSAFLGKAGVSRPLRRLRIAVAVPSALGAGERLAVLRAVRTTVDADVYPVDQALAAAAGAGLPAAGWQACMIVNIGAGATEIAVLSRGSVVRASSVPLAGQDLDAAIALRLEASHRLLVGEPTAERLKVRMGSAAGPTGRESLPVVGRSAVQGVPRGALVAPGEVREAILPVLDRIGGAVRDTLAETPPELLGCLKRAGVVLTGGSALLQGLDDYLARQCGLPVAVAEDPASCVARGLGPCLDAALAR